MLARWWICTIWDRNRRDRHSLLYELYVPHLLKPRSIPRKDSKEVRRNRYKLTHSKMQRIPSARANI